MAEAGDHLTEGIALRVLARLARRRGCPEEAIGHLEEGLEKARRLNDHWSQALCLHELGSIAVEADDHEGAEALLSEALEIFGDMPSDLAFASCAADLGRLHLARHDPLSARAPLARCLRVGFTSGRRIAVARALEALAELALAEEESSRAAALAGVAADLRTSLDRPSAETVRLRSAVERRVGAGPAAQAWNAWRSLPLEQIRDRALAFPRPQGARPSGPDSLTPREREIATLAERGLSNREIAEELTISQATAARHIANIFRKLSISSRTQLTGWAAPREPG